MKIASPHYKSQPQVHDNYNTDADNALNHIPADLPRDEWVKIAAAFKAAGGDVEAFDAWSSTASNYNSKDCIALWKSLSTGGGIGAGTLFYIAQQYGYKSTGSHPDFSAIKEQAKQRQQSEQQAKQLSYKQAQQQAELILDKCAYAAVDHAYLIAKQIQPRLIPWIDDEGWLIIPVMDLQSVAHSLQFISPKGEKWFLSGGAIKGHFYQLWSASKPDGAIVICEGYATGVTSYSHYVPDCTVIVAFNAGNLLPVAKVFRESFPDATIIIAGDFDLSGVGQKAAKEAALAVGGSFTLPIFLQHESGSDFNDRWCLDNMEAVA